MKRATLFLRRFTNLVYYDKPWNSLPFFLIISIAIWLTFNDVMVIISENSLEKRLVAIKECAIYLGIYVLCIERGLSPNKSINLIELIENEFEEYHRDYLMSLSVDKRSQFEKLNERRWTKMEKSSQKIFILVTGTFVGALTKHFFNALLGVAIYSEGGSNDWPTPFVYWCPSGFNNLDYFVYIYFLQSFMFLITAMEGHCLELSICLASERVLADFETMYYLIEDLANNFSEVDINYKLEDSNVHGIRYDETMRTAKLRRDLSVIVRCHQNMYRNFRICETSLASTLLMIGFIMISETGANFYIIFMANNMKTFLIYSTASLLAYLVIFYPFYSGQLIANQNDVLRQSLSKLPWIDKPQWFKKTVCIMMLRANVDVIMKSYGLQELTYVTFKSMTKAAFSYGNFLYTYKMESQVKR